MMYSDDEPVYLDEMSRLDDTEPYIEPYLQSFNTVAMRHIFSFLNAKELATASSVCTSWNMISKDKILWRHVQLDETMVNDWKQFIDIIVKKGTTTLNAKGMLMPSEFNEFENFWTNFISEIKRATLLCKLKLSKCPINVVQECINTLPQLSVLSAPSIIYTNEIIVETGVNELKSINLSYVSRMVNLTKLKLKAQSGIKMETSSTLLTFENLTKLRTLSLTSIKSFPINICRSLETVTTSLERLEIGDCDRMPDDLPVSIKRFTNLKMLRLENCFNKEKEFVRELLVSIRSLKKLKTLELVNIEVTDCVKEELGKCTGLAHLLIIPCYMNRFAATNRYLIDCFEKLSHTLKFVVWGVTYELLHITDLFINEHLQILHTLGTRTDISLMRIPFNYIPILNTSARLENESEKGIDIHSVSSFENLVKITLVSAITVVIKIPSADTNKAHIRGYLKQLNYVY